MEQMEFNTSLDSILRKINNLASEVKRISDKIDEKADIEDGSPTAQKAIEQGQKQAAKIAELKTELRDAEDRYGRLDAMLEQTEGDIDKIATLLGLHHENEDREVLISRIRDRIEHLKEERDKFNQMYDDESRILRQAEGELSKIATALGVSNENGSDVRFELMTEKIKALKVNEDISKAFTYHKQLLAGLLARIHRDGGHAIERLGIDAAVQAADAILSGLLVDQDQVKEYKEAFEAELEGNKKIREILGAYDDETMFQLAERITQRKISYQNDMRDLHDQLSSLADRCRDRKGMLDAGEM